MRRETLGPSRREGVCLAEWPTCPHIAQDVRLRVDGGERRGGLVVQCFLLGVS